MSDKEFILGKDFHPFKKKEMWDVLIVLDCCRFQEFQEYNKIPGTLVKRISFSTDTGEFVDSLAGLDLKKVVVVSGNPIFRKEHFDNIKVANPFLHIEPVWDYGWSDELKTTPPQAVTEAAIKVRQNFPDKKLVVWYMQPHHPFIGDHKLAEDGYKAVIATAKGGVCNEPFRTVYSFIRDGTYTYAEALRAYADNLKLVLKELKPLLNFSGRKIITSDHGDYLGENGKYGHPRGRDDKLLVEVPWFEVD